MGTHRRRVVGLLIMLLTWLTFSVPVYANNWIGVASVAMHTQEQNALMEMPWLSQLQLDIDANTIRRANGVAYMTRPNVVTSGYDRRVQYDTSKFYEEKQPRLNAIIHYAGRVLGEVISIGLDSGYSAAKIRVKPALFLGYTRAFNLAENTMLSFGLSGWIGGAVKESPCRDSYNSEYYCPTLTAWSDYQPPDNSVQLEYGLVWMHRF